MCSHEEQETRDLLNARKELEAAIPLLRDELAKKLGEMRGETVQLQPDEPWEGNAPVPSSDNEVSLSFLCEQVFCILDDRFKVIQGNIVADAPA